MRTPDEPVFRGGRLVHAAAGRRRAL